MTKLPWRALPRNGQTLPKSDLPLFAWADARNCEPAPLSMPRAALRISQRFGLSLTIARLVAEQAGFPMEAVQ